MLINSEKPNQLLVLLQDYTTDTYLRQKWTDPRLDDLDVFNILYVLDDLDDLMS